MEALKRFFGYGILTVIFLLLSLPLVSPLPSQPIYTRGFNWEETCLDGHCSRIVYSYNKYVPNEKGELVEFTDVYDMSWNNGFELNWWDGNLRIEPVAIVNGQEFSVVSFKDINPQVDVAGTVLNNGVWKYNLGIDIPAQIAVNLDNIGFRIVSSKSLSIEDGGIRTDNGLFLSFTDLVESGFPITIINESFIMISNVSKASFILDPTIEHLPNGTTGIDNHMRDNDPYNNNGIVTQAWLGESSDSNMGRILTKLNLTEVGLPASITINSFKIMFYVSGDFGTNEMVVYPLLTDWDEGTGSDAAGNSSWYAAKTGGRVWSGGTEGTDYDGRNNASIGDFGGTGYFNVTLNVTWLQDWIDSVTNNYGIEVICPVCEGVAGDNGAYIKTSDFATVVQRPSWFIDYSIVSDTDEPYTSNNIVNNGTGAIFGDTVNWTDTLVDDTEGSYYCLENNMSGFWSNETFKAWTTPQTVDETLVVNKSYNSYICAKYWFNDTSNNQNETEQSCFTVGNNDTFSPTWDAQSTNASTITVYGGNVSIQINIYDETNLSHAKLSSNYSGTWINITNVSTGAVVSLTLNETMVINATFNQTVCSRYWFNDTSNNQNMSDEICFVVSRNDSAPVITMQSPDDTALITDGTITFAAVVTDDWNITNISLWLNFTGIEGGSWWNYTINLSPNNASNNTFTINYGSAEGEYVWGIQACDNSTSQFCTYANRTFKYVKIPVVALSLPLDNEVIGETSKMQINLSFETTTFGHNTTSLFVNGVRTNDSFSGATSFAFDATSGDYYDWYVRVYDIYGQIGNSTTYSFRIGTASAGVQGSLPTAAITGEETTVVDRCEGRGDLSLIICRAAGFAIAVGLNVGVLGIIVILAIIAKNSKYWFRQRKRGK